ncbi:MAG: PilZ domain-containing protein [Deltaproteobacteria bacterium]|nr:MAG: PilZ domain-containing protein [Deltaproteobacteria bacterium]
MRDLPRLLREYARLERARTSTGLSPRDLSRWEALKQQLDSHFSPGMKPDAQNRRASVRVPTRIKARFESLGKLQDSIMTNLSQGGVFINTAYPLEIGENVTIRIDVDEDGSTLEIPGRVVTTRVGSGFATQKMGMGIAFSDMEPDLRQKVDELYERALERQARRSDEAS